MDDNLDDVDVMNGPVHLVGEEDDEAACGAGDSPVVAFYWRKVTCPDCLNLIEHEERARTAATDGMAAERQAIREEVRQVALGCLTCGQVHQSRPVPAVNGEIAYQHHTSAAEDGHAYRPRYRGMEPEDLGAIILHGIATEATP